MSALSASKILLKGSDIPGRIPTLSSLEHRELAINFADGIIYAKTSNDNIVAFCDRSQAPLVFNSSLSAVLPQYGNNNVTNDFGAILNGVNNTVSGAGSVIVNGESNDIESDLSFIGSGTNNTISLTADYGAILGGSNNNLDHTNSFIVGSNITSHAENFTYVNNLSVLGKIYGDGSDLLGVTGGGGSGDESVNTLVRSASADWNATHTTVQANSATWGSLKKFDMVYSPITVSYSGIAPSGSLTSQSTWTITRITYTTSGTVSAQGTALNTVWDSRLSLSYT